MASPLPRHSWWHQGRAAVNGHSQPQQPQGLTATTTLHSAPPTNRQPMFTSGLATQCARPTLRQGRHGHRGTREVGHQLLLLDNYHNLQNELNYQKVPPSTTTSGLLPSTARNTEARPTKSKTMKLDRCQTNNNRNRFLIYLVTPNLMHFPWGNRCLVHHRDNNHQDLNHHNQLRQQLLQSWLTPPWRQVLQTNNNHDRFLIYLVSINRCFVSFVFYVQGKDI